MTTEVVDTECCGPGGCCADDGHGCCGNDDCCCSMPHGKKVLFPTITLTIAAVLSMIVLWMCDIVQPEGYSRYSYYYYEGLWRYCEYAPSSSSNYSSATHYEDPSRKVAMSFGLLACIVGTGAMIGLWPITCKPYTMTWIRIIGGIVLFAFISQVLTLTMFGTEYCNVFGCQLSAGGIVSVVAMIVWLVGAVMIFVLIPEPPSRHEEGGVFKETVQTTEKMLEDGTKITEKVTTGPDGTKTIEKTIEKPEVIGVEQPQASHAVTVDQEV